MKTQSCRYYVRFAFTLLLIGLNLLCVVWVRKEQRQYALDRQLIAALNKSDAKQTLALLDAGADPNTWEIPSPSASLPELINKWLHCLPSPENNTPTALTLVCGALWLDEHGYYRQITLQKQQRLQMTKALLLHGANVNAKIYTGADIAFTALDYAVIDNDLILSKQLLDHGADQTLGDELARTPIMFAETVEHSDMVALLRQYSKSP